VLIQGVNAGAAAAEATALARSTLMNSDARVFWRDIPWPLMTPFFTGHEKNFA
jgi:hypothetical protein